MQNVDARSTSGHQPGSVSAFIDRMEERSVSNLTLMDDSNQAAINAENNPPNEMLMYLKLRVCPPPSCPSAQRCLFDLRL